MQPDERVGVQPVPTGAVPAVDHHHADVGVVDQGVHERHPRRACTDDQVIGLQDRSHGLMLRPTGQPVNAGPRTPHGASSGNTAQEVAMGTAVRAERLAAQIDGPFVVFLIGMRVNKPWKVRSWVPTFLAMPKMLKELDRDPATGFLGAEGGFGTIIQYWRSFEDLERYATRATTSTGPPGGRSTSRSATTGATSASGTRRSASRRVPTRRSTQACRSEGSARSAGWCRRQGGGRRRRSGWPASRHHPHPEVHRTTWPRSGRRPADRTAPPAGQNGGMSLKRSSWTGSAGRW